LKKAHQMISFIKRGPAKQEAIISKKEVGHRWCPSTYLDSM
ncbi:hypothetical protein A2U01_0063869, partial [Trifolium medium]|nr:hypothetical protein [Trifolium medium]